MFEESAPREPGEGTGDGDAGGGEGYSGGSDGVILVAGRKDVDDEFGEVVEGAAAVEVRQEAERQRRDFVDGVGERDGHRVVAEGLVAGHGEGAGTWGWHGWDGDGFGLELETALEEEAQEAGRGIGPELVGADEVGEFVGGNGGGTALCEAA